MALQLGDVAPDFTAESTNGPIRFHEWLDGSWGVLFSHPKNFTPVCTTEFPLNYPLIADPDRRVATLYGMIHPNASDTMTVRSVFIIGPDTRIKLMLTYPASAGRNFDELLRSIDSLQLTARHQLATPVNWRPGEDVIIVPAVSDEQARERFPNGWKAPKPYLRVVPTP
jgi:alkyl hydroperoxide reductase subunit AhpC